MTQTDFHHATPVYEYFDGWNEDITGARTLRRPAEDGAGVRHRARGDERRAVRSIGVGPDREQTLELRSLLP